MSAFTRAQRYIGIHEIAGNDDHPLIQWWLSLCGYPTSVHDEVAWCSAFVNGMAWDERLPRSKSAAARSWLTVGMPITLAEARAENDAVILKRGPGIQPGPEVLQAQGHVGLYAGIEGPRVILVSGNIGDGVALSSFPIADILGVRRLIA